MRIVDALENIKDTLEANVPDALAAESLDDFDEYRDTDPSATDKRSLAVYLDSGSNGLSDKSLRVLIQLQLFGILDSRTAALYGDIVNEQVRKNINPTMVGMTNLQQIDVDYMPVQEDAGTSFVFLTLDFTAVVDDCTYDDAEAYSLFGFDTGLYGFTD